MQQEFYQVDAFTNRPFTGNPATICILKGPRGDKWMQNVAREMGLSETAFLLEREDGFNLRWFTPAVEVDLCGHATLASAHILWETGELLPNTEARFHTKSGLLTAVRDGSWIALNFPAEPEKPATVPDNLAEALGTSLNYVGRNRFDYLIEAESADVIRKMDPDLTLLNTIPSRGFIVTSPADSEEYDFISRFFAPGAGINEDPVSGSAHCCLGPFWAERFQKNEMTAYQASRRGGVVKVRVEGDRVIIGGHAVTVLKGKFY